MLSRLNTKNIKVYITDYWFLHNPRKINCEYSLGRGNWGCKATLPPELSQGFNITEKADVWAFGICLYYWATKSYPDENLLIHIRHHGKDILASKLPLCWGEWLTKVIFMCLQYNPNQRPSSETVHTFLVSEMKWRNQRNRQRNRHQNQKKI